MKKLSLLFSVFVLLTAFTCENEPLEGDFVTEEPNVTCEEALMDTATAAQALAALTEENYEEEYTDVCVALKLAFENQLEACGDPDGSLQAAIDALGTCNLNASPCEIATSAAATAQQVYNQATEEEFTEACNAYAFVLQQKINECGDEDGSIQDIIDGLGDCTQTSENGQISVTAGTLPIVFDIINIVVVDNILKVTGETSASNNYAIYFEVAQGETGDNIIDGTFVLTLTSDFFPSTFDPPFNFISTISVNSNNTLTGSFGGVVTNADGGDLNLSAGNINVTY